MDGKKARGVIRWVRCAECSGARTGLNTVGSGFGMGSIGVRFGGRGASAGRGQDWVRMFGRGGEAIDVNGCKVQV